MKRIYESPFGYIDLGRIIRITPLNQMTGFTIYVELGTPMHVEWEQPSGDDWREKYAPMKEAFTYDYHQLVSSWMKFKEDLL